MVRLLSTSSTKFDDLQHLAEISALARHHRSLLLEAASAGGPSLALGLHQELIGLRNHIEGLTQSITSELPELERLAAAVGSAPPAGSAGGAT